MQVTHFGSHVLQVLFSKYLPEAQLKHVVAVPVQVIQEVLSQSKQLFRV